MQFFYYLFSFFFSSQFASMALTSLFAFCSARNKCQMNVIIKYWNKWPVFVNDWTCFYVYFQSFFFQFLKLVSSVHDSGAQTVVCEIDRVSNERKTTVHSLIFPNSSLSLFSSLAHTSLLNYSIYHLIVTFIRLFSDTFVLFCFFFNWIVISSKIKKEKLKSKIFLSEFDFFF